MKIASIASILLAGSLLIVACDSGSTKQNATPAAAPAVEVVKWPAISEIDELAERGGAAAKANDVARMKELGAAIAAKAAALSPESIPANAKAKDEVKVLVGDLKSLAAELAGAESMAEADLKTALDGVHSVVARILTTSGVPHVHGDHEGHDHDDHAGHDHGTPAPVKSTN